LDCPRQVRVLVCDETKRREVAHTRIGRRVRFTAENLAEIIAAGRVGADPRRKR